MAVVVVEEEVGASLVAAIDEESDGYMRCQCEGNGPRQGWRFTRLTRKLRAICTTSVVQVMKTWTVLPAYLWGKHQAEIR